MKNKFLTRITLFALLIIAIAGYSSAAWGGTVTVYNWKDLKIAIENPERVNGDVIMLGNDFGNIPWDAESKYHLDWHAWINKNITLDGNGRNMTLGILSVYRGIPDPLFTVEQGYTFTVKNVNFVRGAGLYRGPHSNLPFVFGYSNNSTLRLEDVSFNNIFFRDTTGTHASGYIAGLAVLSVPFPPPPPGILHLKNVNVTNIELSNEAKVYPDGGLFYFQKTGSIENVNIVNTENYQKFANNCVYTSIYLDSEAEVTISGNNRISGTSIPNGSSAMYLNNNASVTMAANSTLSIENTALSDTASGLHLASGALITMPNTASMTFSDITGGYAGVYQQTANAKSITWRNLNVTNCSFDLAANNTIKHVFENSSFKGKSAFTYVRSAEFIECKIDTNTNTPFAIIGPNSSLKIVSSDIKTVGALFAPDGGFIESVLTCVSVDMSGPGRLITNRTAMVSAMKMNVDNCTVIMSGNDTALASQGTLNLTNSTVIVTNSANTSPMVIEAGGNINILHSAMILDNAALLGANVMGDPKATIEGSVVLGFLDGQWGRITSNGGNMFNVLPAIGAHATDIAKGEASLQTLFLTVGSNSNLPQLESVAFRSPISVSMQQLGSKLRDNAGVSSLRVDQRGFARPDDINSPSSNDIGSVEVQKADLPVVTGLRILGFDTAIGLVAGGVGQAVEVSFDFTPKGYNYNFNSLIEWSTSSSDIVEIEGGTTEGESGKVTLVGVNPGTARVTVMLKDVGAADSLDVVVISSLASLTEFDFNNQNSIITNGQGMTTMTVGLDSGARLMKVECEAADSGGKYAYKWNIADESVITTDTTQVPPTGGVYLKPVSAGTTKVGVTVTYQNFSLTASCDVKVTPLYRNVGIKFEEPIYVIPVDKSTNTLLKVVHIEEEITQPGDTQSARGAFSAPSFVLPDEISFEGFYVNGENVYIYVKPKKTGWISLDVKLDSDKNWPAASCDIIIYDPNPTTAATELSASALFSGINESSLNKDKGAGTRVLQGPDLFESVLFRNSGTLLPLSKGETNFFSILDNLPGKDPAGVPLNWFAVKEAAFVPIEAGDPTAPLGIRIPGGRYGSSAEIASPLGYPAEQRFLPMQAIFIVPRGVYGAGAHDRALANPSLLLTEYCKILTQLPDSSTKRTVDLFGGSIENLTVEKAVRAGALEFFKNTATGELLAVLNFLLIDGAAPAAEGGESSVTFEGGLLRIYDGKTDGIFRERMWIAERRTNNASIDDGEQKKESGTEKSSGKAGSGCNAGAGMFGALALAVIIPLRGGKRR